MSELLEASIPRPKDPSAPNEVIRLMPRGVRQHLVETPPEDMPSTILTWCNNHNLIRPSTRRGYRGRLVLTTLGDRVVRQLNQRMKGYV